MNHRFCLFYSGYTTYAPTLYFKQKLVLRKLDSELNKNIKIQIQKYSEKINDSEEEYFSYIKTSDAVAIYFELDVQIKSTTEEDYFLWLKNYTSAIENRFPMSKIDHYYFLFARRLAEIISNIRLAKTQLELSQIINQPSIFFDGISKCFQDNEYIIFKLVAPAALLSGENRHGYFNAFYKEINSVQEKFKSINLISLKETEIETLIANLDIYDRVVLNGFKKCITLLKELEI